MNTKEPLQLDNTGTGKIGSIRVSSSLSTKNKMLKILKETREYYSKDPDNRRCITKDGECMYTWGDNHCAIGRYMDEEYQFETWKQNNESVIELMDSEYNEYNDIDWCLRDDVHGLDVDFWRDLQGLHDTCSNWITNDSVNLEQLPTGISPQGIAKYHAIQLKIEEGRYDG